MKLVNTENGYDFYAGTDKEPRIYNIVPEGSPAPGGGYYSKKYISDIKGVSIDLFKEATR